MIPVQSTQTQCKGPVIQGKRTGVDGGEGVEGRDGREGDGDGGQADLLASKAEGAAGQLQLLVVLVDLDLRVEGHSRLAARLRRLLRRRLLLERLHLWLTCWPHTQTNIIRKCRPSKCSLSMAFSQETETDCCDAARC